MALKYCEIALPVPVQSLFTYAIPEKLASEELIGRRVLVPFRNRKAIGVGLAVSDKAPEGVGAIKEIIGVLDPVPALPASLIALGRWISDYYVAPIGETFRSLLPPDPETRQEREYSLTEAGREFVRQMGFEGAGAVGGVASGGDVADAEQEILRMLGESDEPVSSTKIKKIRNGGEAVARLIRARRVQWNDVMLKRHLRSQKIVDWNEAVGAGAAAGAGAVSAASGKVSRQQEKEERVREVLIAAGAPLTMAMLLEKAQVTRAVVDRLEKQGRVTSWEEPVASEEDSWDTDFTPPSNVLNAEQSAAVEDVNAAIAKRAFQAFLLHGVTGSGKTEVYLAAVETALEKRTGALILVPEIALTLWMGRLVRARFGPRVAILHSGLPDAERAREWWRVRRGEATVVVGTRSAVFAPLENLGLILVDEEQESAYKQEETPRYQGRDTAIYRARLESAPIVLGSATPSLESYQNARSGKYELLQLKTRVENRPLATVKVVDLREEFRATHKSTPISESLRVAIAARLEAGTQAMVLINRRGYSWFLLCRGCGNFLQCRNCSIALTYHKSRRRLECHYCGYSMAVPKACPKCSQEYLYFVGDGAERVEEYLREKFPKARVGRLDRDTVRTKKQFQQVLGAFAKGELDILVGTQMVAKGHDFERVTLVGVVAADLALGRPDFRAAERTFQLLTQVAGRAGRGKLLGEVLVETFFPDHYAIACAARQDYLAFFEKEAHFRRMLHYPPFVALANILVRDKKIENAIRWSKALAEYFAPFEKSGIKVLGPAAAPLARIREEFRFQFLLKSPKRSILTKALHGTIAFGEKKQIPATAVVIDVDPASLS
jgi:primosomal protein N' (replication factor Y)